MRWQTIDVSVPLRLPRLEDTHVVLRAFVDGDAHLIQDVSTDPFIPLITSVPDVPDIEAARAFLHRQQARLDDHAGYSFAIADSASNEALGQIGLWLPDLMQGRVRRSGNRQTRTGPDLDLGSGTTRSSSCRALR